MTSWRRGRPENGSRPRGRGGGAAAAGDNYALFVRLASTLERYNQLSLG